MTGGAGGRGPRVTARVAARGTARRAAWVAAWVAGWAAVMLAAALLIVRLDIAERRERFQADARSAHRLLSQRAAQHEAMLATLVLLAEAGRETRAETRAETRLIAIHPELLAVRRRDGDATWPDAALQAAEARSRASGRAELVLFDAAAGRATVLLAGQPASLAFEIDLRRLVPWAEWPLQRDGPVRVQLAWGDQVLLLQPGQAAGLQPAGLTQGFVFEQPLAVASQPYALQLQLATGPALWPWRLLLGWALASAAVLAAVAVALAQRRERRRARELLRIGQRGRLDLMGELAAGLAHELNQPLAAVLANAQGARRLLDDEPPDLAPARHAMQQAAAQARRAADVLARLRRLVAAPDSARQRGPVPLQAVARAALALLAPQARLAGIELTQRGEAPPVLADAVALEQIVHNLVGNAMQALQGMADGAGARRIELLIAHEGGRGLLTVQDSGPGIAADVLPHLFEPFFSTRPEGLGLGLSLCESLARGMQGTLEAHNLAPHGAAFVLSLELA